MTQSVMNSGSNDTREVPDVAPKLPRLQALLTISLAALAACTTPSARPDGAPDGARIGPPPVSAARAAVVEEIASFGDGEQGFVWWLARGGALAVVYLFEDTDGSGSIELAFGHHGESLGDQPVAHLVRMSDGSRTRLDEVVATSPSGRYIATIAGGDLIVWDGDTGDAISTKGWAVDMNGDGNRCMSPRQLAFDGDGGVWHHDANSSALMWRALDGSARRRHAMPAGSRSWRAEPVAPGWGAWLTVPTDSDGDGALTLPIQNTSCACLHCNRFAASFGFYGWGGDAFAFSLLPAGGGAPVPAPGYARPLTRDVFTAQTDDGVDTYGLDGAPVALPEGCSPPDDKVSAAGALAPLQCGRSWRLWAPGEDSPRELEVELIDIPKQSSEVVDGAHWIGALVRTEAGTLALARVSLEDGAAQVGEPLGAQPEASTRPGSWIATTHDGRMHALDLATGRQITGGEAIEQVSGHLASSGDAASLVDYGRGLIAPLPAPATHTTDTGCALMQAGPGEHPGVEKGPWTLWCAKAP